MAVSLPDGATVAIATGYGAVKAVSAISNADPGVVTSPAHGLLNGAFYELKTGWQKISERIFKAANVAANVLDVSGINTTDANRFPVGSSAGSLREITAWTQIPQILEFTTNGGDQQFANFSFLEEDYERQLPTVTSAQSIQIGIGDDPTLPGYQALKLAGETRAIRAIKITLPNGSVILYNGYVSFNETPTLTKGQVMQVRATISLQGRPVRYQAA
ncbi:phage tail protein [Acidovorax sp. NCPPB 3576]|uniref:phage tail protein n=1 Tax=Acidovorax sp. NCPPB 3576 TaxID=2940488 RepID=UPI00234BCDA5|nr:phage tail protein [Acidovorax sp. NCPPB 3576]WCM86648.1 phage tail protein [Acidovorax sp. NCPPB 3576]WCM88847.1 phage tail protein [Acidovorax sp. NCPPB 3576]